MADWSYLCRRLLHAKKKRTRSARRQNSSVRQNGKGQSSYGNSRYRIATYLCSVHILIAVSAITMGAIQIVLTLLGRHLAILNNLVAFGARPHNASQVMPHAALRVNLYTPAASAVMHAAVCHATNITTSDVRERENDRENDSAKAVCV